jgi:PhnB protein
MPTHPYIHFQGNCAEALQFYHDLFGGSDLQIMRYDQTPGGDARAGAAERVMHGQLCIGDGVLMASDYPPGVEGDAQSGFSVMQVAPDPACAQVWFEGLAKAGAVIAPFGPTFFAPAFGMVKDRFGTHWIISCLPTA